MKIPDSDYHIYGGDVSWGSRDILFFSYGENLTLMGCGQVKESAFNFRFGVVQPGSDPFSDALQVAKDILTNSGGSDRSIEEFVDDAPYIYADSALSEHIESIEKIKVLAVAMSENFAGSALDNDQVFRLISEHEYIAVHQKAVTEILPTDPNCPVKYVYICQIIF